MYAQDLDNGLGVRGSMWPPPGYRANRQWIHENLGGQQYFGVRGATATFDYGDAINFARHALSYVTTVHTWLDAPEDQLVAKMCPGDTIGSTFDGEEDIQNVLCRQQTVAMTPGIAVAWARARLATLYADWWFRSYDAIIAEVKAHPNLHPQKILDQLLGGPTDPCAGKTCPSGEHCENGSCIKDGTGGCPNGCPAGQHCDGTACVQDKKDEKDNTILYLGIGAIALVGVAMLAGGKKKVVTFSPTASPVAGHTMRRHRSRGR